MERVDNLQIDNLKIIQNTEGFRFGIDSVLLTEFCKDLKLNSEIIDFGCGNGILGLLLSKKINPKKIIGIEIQEEVANLANRNIKLNSLENIFSVLNKNVKDLILSENNFKNKFDAVITNPPYKRLETGINSQNKIQLISRFEMYASLEDWIEASAYCLKDKASLYMVYRVDRLTELIKILNKYNLEIKRMRFVHSKINDQSNLVLIKAVKGAGVFLKIENPLIIYNDDGTYTDEVMEIYKKDYIKKEEK